MGVDWDFDPCVPGRGLDLCQGGEIAACCCDVGLVTHGLVILHDRGLKEMGIHYHAFDRILFRVTIVGCWVALIRWN
jgi:hypothetical protein